MALHRSLSTGIAVTLPTTSPKLRRVYVCHISGKEDGGLPGFSPQSQKTPAEEFAQLASVFRRRVLVGAASASLVAVGANFAGITSFLLSFKPEIGRSFKLDVVYPIGGYSRCLETSQGFEFTYPANWVGDQRLLYGAIGKLESERSLDPPPLNSKTRRLNEPVVAFGPPGSDGELNVSVIVSPVPLDFSIETFGGPKEVGETLIRKLTGSQRPDINASLIESTVREDPVRKINYYNLEFRVESPSFRRHNVAVLTAHGGRLFTLNAQSPESSWPTVRESFYEIANSFVITS